MAEVSVRSLGRSSLFAGLAEVWRVGSRIVLTPIIITKLGLEGYGTWTLLFGICSYVSMFNTSFGFAYSKFTAEHDRTKEYGRLAEIIGSGMTLIGGVAFAALTIIWMLRNPLLGVLNVPEELMADAGWALLLVAFCLLLRMSFGCVFQILAGLQRIDLRYKMTILASVVEFGVAIWLLIRGRGLMGLAIGHFCGQVLATAVAWMLCRRLCPALRISPLCVTRGGLRSILSLGGRFQLLAFLTTGLRQGLKLIISAVCGIAALGVFELAFKLLTLASTAGGSLLAPMMPAFANLHAGDDDARWRTLYERGTRILSAVSVTAFAFLAVFADRAIMIWTGQEFPQAAWTIRALTATYFLNMLTGMITANLRGRGTVRLETYSVLLGILVFAVVLGPWYWLAGYEGIVLAYACSSVATIWMMVAFARQESLSVMDYFRKSLFQPVLVGTPVIILTIGMRTWYGLHSSLADGRAGLLIELAVWGAVFAAAIGLSMWYGVFDRDERKALASYMRTRRRPVEPAAVAQQAE